VVSKNFYLENDVVQFPETSLLPSIQSDLKLELN